MGSKKEVLKVKQALEELLRCASIRKHQPDDMARLDQRLVPIAAVDRGLVENDKRAGPEALVHIKGSERQDDEWQRSWQLMTVLFRI